MKTVGSGASRGRGDGSHNEDAFLAEEGLGLYVVCDGASARPAGEIAAGTAVSALEEFVEREQSRWGTTLARTFSSSRFAERAVRHALHAVLDVSREVPAFEGMATTLSMLLVHAHRGAVSHAGDSRVYLHRDFETHLLTHDHALTTSLDLARPTASGAESELESLEVDTFGIDLRAGDTFLLCTDGAEHVVEKVTLSDTVGEIPPRHLAQLIVTAAHRENPGCDATVVVVRVRDDDEPAWLWLSKPIAEFTYGHSVAYAGI